MMLKKLLKEERNYSRFPNSLRQRPFFELECERIEPAIETKDLIEEYSLVATVAVTFRAYQSNYHDAKALAERTLIHRLYSDILSEIPRLELAITGGDGDSALECVSRIKDFIYGDE